MTDQTHPTTVLVTGATGYVAGWLVKALLKEGHTVHAAVRDPSNRDKVAHLDAVAAEQPGEIRYFQGDLLEDGSYHDAMQGCEIVFHTASPFIASVADPQRDLVNPAVKGTRNVLNSVNATTSVRRVVLTSSVAAIYGDSADMATSKTGVFTEADWNTSSNLEHQPYSYSKTQAEKAAWEIAEQQDRWNLVTVNPSLVLGPGIKPDTTSESFTIFRQMADGTLKPGAPDITFGLVDVRDVAEAHLRAAFTPEAQGRYIISGHDSTLMDIATILRESFGDDWPFPRRTLPKWLLWLVGPMVNKALTRRFISRNVAYPASFDNTRSKKELGMTYRPLDATVVEMFQQLLDAGSIRKR
ncbi:MAG: aldehyde reductase [Halospina sp.]